MAMQIIPYEEGYCSFFAGDALADNPFIGGLGARNQYSWSRGWLDAESDHNNEMREHRAVNEDYRL